MVNADFWGEPQRGGFWGDEPEPPRRRSPRTTAVDLPVQRPPRRQPSRRPQREEPPRRPPRPDADARRPSGNTRSQKNQKKKRKRSGLVTALALVILFASLGGGGYYGYLELSDRFGVADYQGEGTGRVTIEVAEGDYTSDVGQTLVEADVVKSVTAFVRAAGERLQGLQPGFYVMRKQMSAAAAVALLLDPKSRTGVVNIPPGKWASEIYTQLSKSTGIPVAKFKKVDPRTLGLPRAAKGNVEGYLYPGRYDLPPDATAQELLAMMVARFKQETRDVDFSRARRAGLTPGEVMTVASLIEAEAGRPSDYRKISRVIYNRLKANMRLQFDTAILYAWQQRTLDVRNRHLEIDSPYNVYRHDGLPPGPIGNPGIEAIKAALNPAPGKWLYFVATNPTKRITKYADDYEDFLKLKAEFERWLKANPQPKN